MRELLNDFLIWLKKPDPDTILIKLWRRKRDRDEVIKDIEAKQRAEEERQKIEEQAYLLWEADGKPEGKDDYYWKLAIDKVKGKNVSTLCKPYYFLEKRILEPIDAWIAKQAFFTILGRLGNLALVVAVVSFVFGENVRRNNEVFAAWTTITTAHEQPGSGGRIRALQFLNSRPLRFPWVGWTEDLFWDEREQRCELKRLFGRRWKREPLAGLSAPGAYLAYIHLCKANLTGANLQEAELISANLQEVVLIAANLQNALLSNVNLQEVKLDAANLQEARLWGANLQEAEIFGANLQEAELDAVNFQGAWLFAVNLQEAKLDAANLQNAILVYTVNLTAKQIKTACFWQEAIYKGEWNQDKQSLIVSESDNINFIEELKKDKLSDPEEPPDCSRWEKEN